MSFVPMPPPAIIAPVRTPDAYEQFLRAKIKFAPETGIEISPSEVNPLLKPHQRDIVVWAIRGGRRAIFAAFGLGKTWIQVEILRLLQKHVGGNALLVCPLGVRQEFVRDAAILGVEFRFIRTNAEVTDDWSFYLTNYESVRDRKLSPDLFAIASLDEASVLRSFGSDTYQSFLSLFANVPFRFVATATPSPNKHKELIHYAGFLGAMDTGQALTRFFARNSEKAADLTLYPHKEQEFWLWVSSWAVFIEKPSDLGYSDEGYDLQKLRVIYHELPSTVSARDIETNGQTLLFRDAAMGLSAAAFEKRDSLTLRIGKMLEIVGAAPNDHFLLWHDLEDERRAIEKALPEAVSVYGSQDLDTREANIIGFSEGDIKYLAAKPVMCGSGCNFQRHCHKAIFLGVGYKFNDWIQAIKRIHRFLQTEECEIHIIHTEAEREILRVLQAKWAQHEEMVTKMTEIIREHGLSRISLQDVLTRTIGVERVQITSKMVGLDGKPYYTVACNDCVLEARRMATDSVQCIITSIPFANQYEYTPSYNDFGHTDNNAHFWNQMDFLTPELHRILEPGRVYCCHVKDRILFGNQTGTGMPTVAPFHAEAIFHGMKHGFQFMGMITVVTDVVRENNQTYRLGWSEQCKDGSKMGVGMPEYILLFRKLPSDTTNSYADNPVRKDKEEYSRGRWQTDAHNFWRSSGNRLITAEEMAGFGTAALAKMFTEFSLENVYDYEFHVKIGEQLDMIGALPSSFMCLAPGSHADHVWHDVARMRTLNNNQTQRGLQNHMCLARDSMVLTRNGYRPIQYVVVGDEVLTHKGRWRRVTVVRNTGVQPVVTLKAQGVPGLTLTPDHKLWTRQVRDLAWSKCHSRKEAISAEPEWVEAQHTGGSYVNQKLPETETPVVTDLLHWWMVGRWLADGHIDKNGGAVLSCGTHEIDFLASKIGRFGGNPFHVNETSAQILLRDSDFLLRRTLADCGTGAAGKHIPAEAYVLPSEQASALLEGYLSGDGHFVPSRNRWMASSISKTLLFGIAMLAQRVHGAIASIYPGRKERTGQILGRTVNMQQEWVLCFDAKPETRNRKPFVLDDGAWKKVRTIEDAGEVETWCLRVDEDESFTAEGCVVKNCPLQFDIVDRLIKRFTNLGDFVFDPFAGIMTVPYRAILSGRRGGGSELNPEYFADGVHYLRSAEEKIAMPNLFDLEGIK